MEKKDLSMPIKEKGAAYQKKGKGTVRFCVRGGGCSTGLMREGGKETLEL